jgi:hypothetical protein
MVLVTLVSKPSNYYIMTPIRFLSVEVTTVSMDLSITMVSGGMQTKRDLVDGMM